MILELPLFTQKLLRVQVISKQQWYPHVATAMVYEMLVVLSAMYVEDDDAEHETCQGSTNPRNFRISR